MSTFPFGFQPPDPDDNKPAGDSPAGGSTPGGPGGGDATDPMSFLSGVGAGDLGAAMHRFADLLSWTGGPVNWDLARNVALEAARADEPSIGAGDREAVTEALRLADLWLDPVTTLPSGTRATEAWTRAEWVDRTLPVWRQLCDTVAARVVEALTAQVAGQLPTEMAMMAGQMSGVMRAIGGALFGTQSGQAIGTLAGEVLSSTDIGLPLGPAGVAALVPANVTAFGADLGVEAGEVRLYLALRECAHQRLFGHVPWLRAHLLSAVDAYAKGIEVDLTALQSAFESNLGGLDPSDPEALTQALSGGLFDPDPTPSQQAALERLATALALVEGWVDEVVDAAAQAHLPRSAALRETVRRRRATGGPAEQTFATLVGLELRPRKLREAAALWHALAEANGIDGRDRVWDHPDLMPGADDLADPAGFVTRSADDAFDLGDLGSGFNDSDQPDPGQPGPA